MPITEIKPHTKNILLYIALYFKVKNNYMRQTHTRTAIKVSCIAQMVFNKQVRDTTPFVFLPCGKGYYLFDGCKVSEEDFGNQFPIDMPPLILKGKNCDGRKLWMHPEIFPIKINNN